MKNWKLITAFAVALTGTAMPAHAELDLSANFGIMSDYIYRGFHQSDAVANGGIDLAAGPFYLGTWLADLDSGSGVEIDVYGGLAWEFENGFSAYVGYTAYRYTEDDDGVLEPHVINEGETNPQTGVVTYTRTGHFSYTGDGTPTENPHEEDGFYHLAVNDDNMILDTDGTDDGMIHGVAIADFELDHECVGTGFDKDYDEINIGIAYAKDDFSASLDYAIGEHENFCGDEDNDYDIAMLTLDYKGAYVTFGTYGISEDDEDKGEPEGDYVEIGYATTINDLDFAVYLVDSDEDIDDETRLGMSVSYGFGL